MNFKLEQMKMNAMVYVNKNSHTYIAYDFFLKQLDESLIQPPQEIKLLLENMNNVVERIDCINSNITTELSTYVNYNYKDTTLTLLSESLLKDQNEYKVLNDKFTSYLDSIIVGSQEAIIISNYAKFITSKFNTNRMLNYSVYCNFETTVDYFISQYL